MQQTEAKGSTEHLLDFYYVLFSIKKPILFRVSKARLQSTASWHFWTFECHQLPTVCNSSLALPWICLFSKGCQKKRQQVWYFYYFVLDPPDGKRPSVPFIFGIAFHVFLPTFCILYLWFLVFFAFLFKRLVVFTFLFPWDLWMPSGSHIFAIAFHLGWGEKSTTCALGRHHLFQPSAQPMGGLENRPITRLRFRANLLLHLIITLCLISSA